MTVKQKCFRELNWLMVMHANRGLSVRVLQLFYGTGIKRSGTTPLAIYDEWWKEKFAAD